jgi:hypothetical protein
MSPAGLLCCRSGTPGQLGYTHLEQPRGTEKLSK